MTPRFGARDLIGRPDEPWQRGELIVSLRPLFRDNALMPEKIFINYRRETDKDAAGRLRDRLESAFSEEGVFIDVDNIRPGRDFVEEISASILQCDIFLSVIGPGWTEVKDGEGRRRLDNPNDWVRIEIETALQQKKTIIPVLLNHAEMPRALGVPESLAPLTRINAARLTHERYGADMRGLITVIKVTRAEAKGSFGSERGQKNDAPTKPDWASAMGRDSFGLWIEISVGDARQKLRWIAPGKFLMGSPATDKGRSFWEGPQHEVTISKGFWLFDTACTQALWRAVMGNDPSRFKGPDRPVECVSWNDAQDFLRRINERIPGLGLSLPSEAQWEYACRAGTRTPFSFGENITPEQVNYDGNYPYAGAPKGICRQETVAVASLPANPWGLYEMHGNVNEWCMDSDRKYKDEPVTDPLGPMEKGAMRILRGGSWGSVARGVRSADRQRSLQDHRHTGSGFRCARVQPERGVEDGG